MPKPAVTEPPAKGEKKTDRARKAALAKAKRDKTKPTERTAYVLRGGALEAVKLKLGITDGRDTELLDGLKEGDKLVVDAAEPKGPTTLASRMLALFKK